jgi:hypothetical protein
MSRAIRLFLLVEGTSFLVAGLILDPSQPVHQRIRAPAGLYRRAFHRHRATGSLSG